MENHCQTANDRMMTLARSLGVDLLPTLKRGTLLQKETEPL